MENNKEKSFERANLIIGIFAIVISFALFFVSSPEKITPQTLILFGIIAIVLLALSFITYIISKWNKMNNDIENNKADMVEIKKALLDIRLSILENLFNKKGKKGQAIDPRIIGWALLLVLLYLLLKSLGIF